MKTKIPLPLLAILLAVQATSIGKNTTVPDSPAHPPAALEPVEISNPENGTSKVFARDNQLVFSGAGGKELAISEPFLSPETDWRPTGKIDCSWSPDGKFLAVFIPHPRVTVIAVVDINREKVLQEVFPEDRRYPAWYDHVFSTADTPVSWLGEKLTVRTAVVTGAGEKKQMERELSISGDTFKIVARDPGS